MALINVVTGVTPVNLVREAGTAFDAAALQNRAAGSAGHALHKTVLVGAMTFFWLIGSFWHEYVNFPKDLF